MTEEQTDSKDVGHSTSFDEFRKSVKSFEINILGNITEFNILLSRNVSVGMAGVAVASILLFVETGITSAALKVSLVGFAICIPLAVSWAALLQVHINAGSTGLSHLRKIHASSFYDVIHHVWCDSTQIAFGTGIGAIIWHLSHMAFYVFVSVAFIAYLVFSLFLVDLIAHSKEAEESDD